MTWKTPAALATVLVLGGLAAVMTRDDGSVRQSQRRTGVLVKDSRSSAAADPVVRLERSLNVVGGSRKLAGEFPLGADETLRLHVVETVDGKSCVLDELDGATGATCVDGGLFDLRRAAFSVDSQGGPGRFRELRLSGIAAPEVAVVVVKKSNGASERLRAGSGGAFLFRSSAADLARDVLPASLVLYSAQGKLVEAIAIPALR